MDLKRCLEVLELKNATSISQVKHAYRELVHVWHPDRFSNNPRLKLKAEKKLKEINAAYEILTALQNGKQETPVQKQSTENHNSYGNPGVTKTEAIFETGTIIVLSLFSQISSSLRQLTTAIKAEIDK